MSVKRRELVEYLEANGFSSRREGRKHSIYSDGNRAIPVKRHRRFDRITANQLCKQAGLAPKF
jgi:mRNA interferase HicA